MNWNWLDDSVYPVNFVPDCRTGTEIPTASAGLAKRELFAAMAMQGLISSNPESKTDNSMNQEFLLVAKYSVQLADALLAELAKPVAAGV